MTKTVIPVVSMKVIVATMERFDRRAIPHTPWPEVQPDPKVTPMPTMTPPMIKAGVDTGTETSGSDPVTSMTTSGPMTMPAKKTKRHVRSDEDDGDKMPAKIPVAPMMRPMVSINKTAAHPINTPPLSD